MKMFTFEELRAFVKEELATGKNVLKCHPRSYGKNDTNLFFIKLEEDLCYETYWRGGRLTFKKGDYLHADPKDVYGLTAQTFENCYLVDATI